MKKTVLTLAAHPDNAENLQLNREIRDIENIIQKSTHRDSFRLIRKDAVRWDDFQRCILEYKPRIVHFCGHGLNEDGLALEDEQGQLLTVSTEVLSSLFEQVAEFVECIILNACYSSMQAKAINAHVNYVVGMDQPIRDRDAIAYAKGFYLALGEGESIEDAHATGCREILKQANDASRSRAVVVLEDDQSHRSDSAWQPELFVKAPPLTVFQPCSIDSVDSVLIASSLVKIISPHLPQLLSAESLASSQQAHSDQEDMPDEQARLLWQKISSHFSSDLEFMGIAKMIAINPQNDAYQQMLSQILAKKLASNLALARELFNAIEEKSGIQRIVSGNEAWIENIRYKMAKAGTQEIKTGDKAKIQNVKMDMM